MDVKAGYKHTDVGLIPEDWVESSLRDLTLKIGSGITPTGGNKRYKDYGHPFVRSQNVGWGRLLLDDLAFIDDETHNSFPATELKQDDVLLNITGASIGRSAIADERLVGGNVNQHVCIVRMHPNRAVPKLINQLLLSSLGQLQIESFQAGGNRQGLNFAQIASIKLPLPFTKSEQEAISEALNDADAYIVSLEQLIAKKRLIKQGAMQELLTGKRRLPEFEKRFGYKQTEIGVLPADWEVSKIGDVSQIFGRIGFRGYTVNDIVEEGKGAITISPSNIRDNKTDFSSCTYISWKKYEESPEIKIKNGDILLVKTGSTVGKTAIVKNLPHRATVNPQIVVLKNIEIDNLFLGYSMGFVVIQKQLRATTVGGALPTLSQKQIANFKLGLPASKTEQSAIAEILSDIDAEIASLEKKLKKAQKIKQGMMQELLTGRIRLI